VGGARLDDGRHGPLASGLRPDDLLAFEIELPSLRGQHAIVDVIRAFETDRTRLVATAEAATALLSAAREHLLDQIDESAPLHTVVKRLEAGSSPKCLDRRPRDDEWAVLKTSAVRPGMFRPTEEKALPSDVSPKERAEVQEGDVVTIRASGSRRLVGAFCRVASTPPRRLLSDYHWRVHIRDDRVDRDYLVEAMASAEVRGQIEDATTGSTTAGKISQASMLALDIPLPSSLERQRRLAGTLTPIRRAACAYEDEALALDRLRRAAVEELLSGERGMAL
jgi:hypothetical protein